MNDFSISRFALLMCEEILRFLRENHLKMMWVFMACVVIVSMILFGKFNNGSMNERGSMFLETIKIINVITVLAAYGSVFNVTRHREKALSFFMLPSTNLEKYLSLFVCSTIIYIIMYLLFVILPIIIWVGVSKVFAPELCTAFTLWLHTFGLAHYPGVYGIICVLTFISSLMVISEVLKFGYIRLLLLGVIFFFEMSFIGLCDIILGGWLGVLGMQTVALIIGVTQLVVSYFLFCKCQLPVSKVK